MIREKHMGIITRLTFILILTGFMAVLPNHDIFADEPSDATTFRCPGGIVKIGDTRFNVLEKCGKPTFTDDYGYVWVYDFGSKDFIRYITFSGDEVSRIQVGGYGESR